MLKNEMFDLSRADGDQIVETLFSVRNYESTYALEIHV